MVPSAPQRLGRSSLGFCAYKRVRPQTVQATARKREQAPEARLERMESPW
jgi:hypothetical protein